jgi:hypothetical protein
LTDQIIEDIGPEYLSSNDDQESELILSTKWAKKIDKPVRIDVECKLTYPGESTKIVNVDLSGFSKLETLERIRLSNAGFTSIDLSPLSTLPNLVYLDLAYNELNELDLEPLSMSKNLQYLLVLGNIYESINIEPIVHLPKLKRVSVGPAGAVLDYSRLLEMHKTYEQSRKRKSNEIIARLSTRMAPAIKSYLFEHEKPPWLAASNFSVHFPRFGDMVEQVGWKRVLSEWNQIPSLTTAQVKKLLNLLDMPELYGFTGDGRELLSVFPAEEMPFEDGRNVIYAGIVSLLEKQIQETGDTRELDIELMKDKQASVLVHDILEQRQKEIESLDLRVERARNAIDVTDFMKTVYGSAILDAIDSKPFRYQSRYWLDYTAYKEVEEALKKLGLSVRVHYDS